MTDYIVYRVILFYRCGGKNMIRGIILYKSKYGSTKKYAYWLSEATGFPARDIKKTDIQEVEQYDVIIYGGGIYASGIAGIKFLKKHMNRLQGKKIIVFCDGASPYNEKALNEIKERNMTGPLSGIPLFYCRGGWDMQSMTPVDRVLCSMLRKSVAKKRSL